MMFLIQGKKYRAKVSLPGWIERHASNSDIEEQFCTAGFTSVHVTGSGTERRGEGIWGEPSRDVDTDEHLSEIQEIG